MACPPRIVDQLGFDPEAVNCRHCNADAGSPCQWPPFVNATDHPDLYHAERLEDAEFDAAMAARIAGTAPDSDEWKAAVKAAAGQLV